MRPKRKSYTLAAASVTGYLSNATGATWTLSSTAGPVDGTAHLVTIKGDAVTDHSGKTAVITGTDANGNAQTETIAALPNGATTVTSTKYFKTVTGVVPSATIGADTMDIGWAAACATPSYIVDQYRISPANIGVTVGGTVTYTAQQTLTDPFTTNAPLWGTLIASGGTSAIAAGNQGATAFRVIVSAHTSGTLDIDYTQGR